MQRLNRIAAHLTPASKAGTLSMAACAGWKMLPGPHPFTTNMYTLEIDDEKAFIAYMDESNKKLKAEGGPLPIAIQLVKMDSGLYKSFVIYANDMDRVANMTRASKVRAEAPKIYRLVDKSVQKTLWGLSYEDKRPMQVTGCRIAITHITTKSPAHMERAIQLNPNGALNAAMATEYKQAGIKYTGMSLCSDTSAITVNILSDENAYVKSRDELMAKMASAMGANFADYFAAPPERELGICIYMKNVEEF
jgi:hypothetical protein